MLDSVLGNIKNLPLHNPQNQSYKYLFIIFKRFKLEIEDGGRRHWLFIFYPSALFSFFQPHVFYFNYSCNQVWFTLLSFYIRGNQEFTILDNFLQGHIARKWWRYYLPLKIILSLRGEGRKIQGILTWDLFFLSNEEYEVVRQEKTSYGKIKKTWRKDLFLNGPIWGIGKEAD